MPEISPFKRKKHTYRYNFTFCKFYSDGKQKLAAGRTCMESPRRKKIAENVLYLDSRPVFRRHETSLQFSKSNLRSGNYFINFNFLEQGIGRRPFRTSLTFICLRQTSVLHGRLVRHRSAYSAPSKIFLRKSSANQQAFQHKNHI